MTYGAEMAARTEYFFQAGWIAAQRSRSARRRKGPAV